MSNPILESWWAAAWGAAVSLAGESDILQLEPCADVDPRRFIAHFHCRGLVREPDGSIAPTDHFAAGIWIPPDYLRRAESAQILRLLWPPNAWHCNIRAPFICIGAQTPGMSLVDILYQLYEIFTWNKYSPHDGLNPDACSWARSADHRRLFPTDRRPLKRRKITAIIETAPRQDMTQGAKP